ncbi:hypothetical protein F5879DRAFT_927459, partial [Lentinula edodes]
MKVLQNSRTSALATVAKTRREGLRSAEKNLIPDPIVASEIETDPVESSPAHCSDSFPTESLPNESCSSTLQLSSDEDEMSTRVNESGRIELSTGKNGPRVKAGSVLSPEDLDDLYEDARRYAKLRAKDDIENVRDTIAEAFSARVHRDWFRAVKSAHLTLALEQADSDTSAPPTFPFLDVLRRKFCGHDWAQVHASRRDDLRMEVGGVGCFDKYLSQVEGCNNQLKGVGNYLTPPQLLTILARGISPTLTAILSEQGIVIDEDMTYKTWVSACRDLEVQFKSRLSSADRQGRRGAFPYNSAATTNNNNNNPAHKLFYMKSFKSMPEALQKEQRELLGRINACPKCRTAWATCGSNLDKCAGATLSVPWKPLTPKMVDWAISAHKSTNRPILYNAILKQEATKMPVAAVHGAPLEDISAYIENSESRAPVAAAIYGNLPVSHVARDSAVYGNFAAPALFHTQSVASSNFVAPVVGQQRLTRDDRDDEVDWSDGSGSPSPKPKDSGDAPHEPSVD